MKRNSNLELLRFIAMGFIVLHHYSVHGGFVFVAGSFDWYKVFVDVLAALGKLGTNVFIVITAYFMIDQKVKHKKVILFFVQVTFYTILMYVVSVLCFNLTFQIKDALKSILPFIYSLNWFATTYLFVYVLSPYLNQFIFTLNKKDYFNLICLLFGVFVLIPTFAIESPMFSNLTWFIVLYFVVGYIKRFQPERYLGNKKCTIISILGLIMILGSVVVFNYIGQYIGVLFSHSAYLSAINRIPAVVTSIAMFLMFKQMDERHNRVINYLSQSIFAIYLIHDNPYFSPYLWLDIVRENTYVGSPYIIINCILSILGIFACGILIDQLRIWGVNYFINKIIRNIDS